MLNKKCKFCYKKLSNIIKGCFCNEACRYNYYRDIYYEKRKLKKTIDIKKICKFCNKEFLSKLVKSNYCSNICKNKQKELELEKRKDEGYFQDRYNTGYLSLRFRIFNRDGFRCKYCGRSPINNKEVVLQVEHIIPKIKGSDNSVNNLITSCLECNVGKKDILLDKHIHKKILKEIKK